MKPFRYTTVESVSGALKTAQETGARYKAGGTDILGLMKEQVESPKQLIDLNNIRELSGISGRPGGGFSIGTTTTVADLAKHDQLGKTYPVLAQAAACVASPQLRNVGTVGGNLCQRPRCWYFRHDFNCLRKGGDTCFAFDGENRFHCVIGGDPCFIVHPSDLAVALTAVSAVLLIQGAEGQRAVPIESFFVLPEEDVTRETILKPGELLTAVQVPGPPPGRRSVYLKTADRTVFDFATVSVGILADVRSDTIHTARVVLGGVAPVPWIEKNVSSMLAGVRLDDAPAIGKIAAHALTDAMPLEENAYKIRLTRNLIEAAVGRLITD